MVAGDAVSFDSSTPHGYRNETDEPAYTQPQMYEAIKAHPPVREVYAKQLEEQGGTRHVAYP